MPSDNVRERKERRRFTFVVVPDAKSEKTRTYSFTRLSFIVAVVSVLIIIVASILAVVTYTPLGTHLPISNSEMSKRYGKQIVEIQKQLQMLVQEVTVLRGYNIRLRKVMGEHISPEDSAALVAGNADTTSVASKFNVSMEDTTYVAPMEQENAVPIDRPIQPTMIPIQERKENDFYSRLPLSMPVSGFVTRGFDPEQFHYGIDFAGKQGSPVYAAADGVVIFSSWTYEDGFMLIISHPQGYLTVYKHNQSLVKSAGENVKRGEIVALLGNTGERSSGAHLHFEVWKDGIVQNPNNYLLSIN